MGLCTGGMGEEVVRPERWPELLSFQHTEAEPLYIPFTQLLNKKI